MRAAGFVEHTGGDEVASCQRLLTGQCSVGEGQARLCGTQFGLERRDLGCTPRRLEIVHALPRRLGPRAGLRERFGIGIGGDREERLSRLNAAAALGSERAQIARLRRGEVEEIAFDITLIAHLRGFAACAQHGCRGNRCEDAWESIHALALPTDAG